jgi:hypothetical protein
LATTACLTLIFQGGRLREPCRDAEVPLLQGKIVIVEVAINRAEGHPYGERYRPVV